MLSADDNEIVFPSWEAAMAAADEAEKQSRRERLEELDAIRLGGAKLDDRQGAVRLVDEVEDLLQRVGSGTRIDDVNDEYRAAYRALAAVLHRLGIAHANPYRDLWRFY